MQNREILAIKLGNQKEAAIRETAISMAESICRLAEAEFMKGSIKFYFKKNYFVKDAVIQMRYKESENRTSWFEELLVAMHLKKPELQEDNEIEKLYNSIVDMFNSVENNDQTEREKVLNLLARELQLDGFSFVRYEDRVEIQWWGD